MGVKPNYPTLFMLAAKHFSSHGVPETSVIVAKIHLDSSAEFFSPYVVSALCSPALSNLQDQSEQMLLLGLTIASQSCTCHDTLQELLGHIRSLK